VFAAHREGRRNSLVNVAEKPARAFQQCFTGNGELDLMCGPLEQLAADQLFEAANLTTQRRLRNIEPFRGAAEVQLFRDRHEGSQVPQLDTVRRLRERKHVCTLVHIFEYPSIRGER
jgi:hypothetical protein